MSIPKNKQRNRLKQPHLSSACLRLKVQDWYSVSNFPYAATLQHWQNSAQYRRYRHAEYKRGGDAYVEGQSRIVHAAKGAGKSAVFARNTPSALRANVQSE
ncbi:hypothetical protein TSOC_003229 [Tetrabaena socialis]|uniref:Uncharacterized protein n=1 Tax=Tetrabaena socialis TaxID=47790 RepID=A0A2J8AC27_9CHLO|nr:hypothetical protein TSOC_003229 [Tetrabaena socialis]|eukprot:PNH10071.1 hypothetical protein TSOC_003229 [Tetrabaena socialis]